MSLDDTRLLLDEMLGPKLANALRELGLDVYGVVERPELRGLSDDLVLDLASREQRVLVTCNVSDFIQLDHQWRADGRVHSGVVLVSSTVFPQDRSWVGVLVRSLDGFVGSGLLPGAGRVAFLHRHQLTTVSP
jgi:hypothetical protein